MPTNPTPPKDDPIHKPAPRPYPVDEPPIRDLPGTEPDYDPGKDIDNPPKF